MSEYKTRGEHHGRTRFLKRGLPANGAPVTTAVLECQYEGNGVTGDPYVVQWVVDDPGNPLFWKSWYKWFIALSVASTTLCVSFCSSAYSGGKEPKYRHTLYISLSTNDVFASFRTARAVLI